MEKWLDILRGAVRPVLGLGVIWTIVGLTIYLVAKFASPELARDFAMFILGTGATITGVYFGERAARKGMEGK